MKKIFILFLINLVTPISSYANLSELSSPFIEGETLYVNGPIDSHIYDFLAYEHEALLKVKTVSLNSLGGSHDWSLLIAEKIKSYGLNTLVEKGNYCASACIYIFGVGVERLAFESVWFGIHGARISGGHVVTFRNLCPEEHFSQTLRLSTECLDFLNKMYALALDKTLEAFSLIENAGVNTSLREFYFSLDDYNTWYTSNNILRKPDLILKAPEAIGFNFVTKLLKSNL